MRNLIFILVLLISKQLTASHIVGGDIYYDYLGNNNYLITVVIFRDCNSDGAAFDNPLNVGIYNSSNNLVQSVTINFPGSEMVPLVFSNPCVDPPNNICTERAIYTATVNLPPIPGGYKLTYQRCCRGPSISNLISPEDTGLTLVTTIPGSETGASVNSSARFDNYPPLVICNNDDLIFDHGATDPDGDVLVYEFAAPFAGATDANPMPTPDTYNPPFFNVNFAGGFTMDNTLGPGATISIDPNTGLLTADPNLMGLFVVGIKVKEYRNGVLINETIRDFLFKVINCDIELASELVPQTEMTGLTSFCNGFTITFDNNSFGGDNYKWDFGVPNTDTDVSTLFEPTFTYPEAGIYTVSLIVNPGFPCTDTSTQIFNIFEEISINYTVEDSMCITNNSHEFIGNYSGPANPTFSWDFGSNASISSSSDLIVPNVSFDTIGFIPVTLNITTGLCEESFSDFVFVFAEPELSFSISPHLKCAPYLAEFENTTFTNSPTTYFWEFGDGETSTERFPSHLYENVGVYDVTLSIQTLEGCEATITQTLPALVQTFPSPTSNFDVNPKTTTVYNPYFYTYNYSDEELTPFYLIDDSIYVYENEPKISFVESGSHDIEQIVINEFGCPDTLLITVKIIPLTTVFVPNAFTPDGNKYNNEFTPVVIDAAYYEMLIFNRWGEVLFMSNDAKKSWDGTFKNKELPQGVYPYKLTYRNFGEATNIEINGHVSLIR